MSSASETPQKKYEFKHPEQSRDVVLGRAPSRHLGVPVLADAPKMSNKEVGMSPPGNSNAV